MMKRIDDINDDELRVIGHRTSIAADSGSGKRTWIYVLWLAFLLAGFIGLCLLHGRHTPDGTDELEEAMYDPIPATPEAASPVLPLGTYAEGDTKAYTEHQKDSINDIPLDIYIPHNATPELCIGVPDMFDKSIVLTTQAADIRADNGKIVGAFVLKGEPLAWGLSKKGYVAIIDGKMTVGVADNSPLFEEATEKGGYFFRQYPLVDNGSLVENELKGKSVRKALCDRNGEIMVVMTRTPESLHDFAQVLVDMRVDNAVYLVGSNSYGYFRDKFDHLTQIYEKVRGGQKFENFVVWKITNHQ